MSEITLDQLPEDCFAQIMSLTSPQDVCRSVLVSSPIRFVADSDTVWEKFLPPNYEEILSRLVSPFVYSSKKELFARLSNPQLIDGGRKIFSIEKSTGKKCYMLSARELSIKWASHPLYWSWKPQFPQSRFAEVAELRTISWLEILGLLNTKLLSPRTLYGTYLILHFANRAYGLDTLPSEVSLEVGNVVKSQGTVYLSRCDSKKQSNSERLCCVRSCRRSKFCSAEKQVPVERKDGWMEIELGQFYNDQQGDEEVRMCLKEVKGEHLKGGLIVEGIELRPIQLH
ncbi:F-box protein PP2-B15-like [Juglans microcarpa x Juglans regia]|uniref:F-box protein PP2-B15-like n=1 Tax=Juglans microcarpa x Juglans regia TaxID=2249226 RepID=UPI001B7E4657|nr:F-box protein PP2-B15-like [Juglans microcarpa x Juglans regia]